MIEFISEVLSIINDYDAFDINCLYQSYIAIDFSIKDGEVKFEGGKNNRDILGSYYTQEEFATKFGKSRTYVTNILGLLKLPEDVKKMVEKRTLSMSHARVLSKIDDEEKVVRLAKQVITDELSVRELEKITQDDKKEIEVVKNKKSGYDHKYRM